MGLGIGSDGGDRVYLDLTHLDAGFIGSRLGAILEIYRKFAGVDPMTEPMEIFPAAHYGMGGLWVDFERSADGGIQPDSPRNHATNIPGLYACGECDYAYHGANRLGANSLLSASYSGRVAGESVVSYLKGLASDRSALAPEIPQAEVARQQAINAELMRADGADTPYLIQKELGALMTAKVGVVRSNPELDIRPWRDSGAAGPLSNARLGESSTWANQSLAFARQLGDMIELARSRDPRRTGPRRVPRCPLQTRVSDPDPGGQVRGRPRVRGVSRSLAREQRTVAQDHHRRAYRGRTQSSATRRWI
jgi:succinate dehydrogenase / fumarate reductase, flavoprotein subunit